MESNSIESSAHLAENLIWDAVDTGASKIHLQPADGGYSVRYRTAEGLENLLEVSRPAFEALDRQLTTSSTPARTENKRRLYLDRQVDGVADRLQVQYQKLSTFTGDRLTLALIKESRFPQSIDDITTSAQDSETLRRWSQAPNGLVLVSGRSGSGKTTTSFCCLGELAKSSDRVIFTIEDPVEILLPDVEQVEVDLNDDSAFRETFGAVLASDPDVLFLSSSVAPRHRATLWSHALSAAESGHLVFVQIDAVSTAHAQELFEAAVERSVEEQLVGVVWQELQRDPETGGRIALYDFAPGPLGD
jgi:type II secretory ATPase GspE/PulE/Tfp pilus assembly ATPase PilB-like protein